MYKKTENLHHLNLHDTNMKHSGETFSAVFYFFYLIFSVLLYACVELAYPSSLMAAICRGFSDNLTKYRVHRCRCIFCCFLEVMVETEMLLIARVVLMLIARQW